ncbi:ABC transporter permease [Permianibacter sp. IMCC34836]|uniref:ABC transporter permease n=1 Tax=Permianibacter fluminis TaxID=2738515 RepID=UPI001552343C|nr:ABC transporter permease [Permianibacter fluminis]NQD37268.1 ABC transporter permease [Permianibacter fluminis]
MSQPRKNMHSINPVSLWTVARFEFLRYFKWKHELINIVILIVLTALVQGGGAMMQWAKAREHYEVAVIDANALPLAYGDDGRLTLLRADSKERDARAADVDAGRLDGLLEIASDNTATLLVNREPTWNNELGDQLTTARLERELVQRGIAHDDFEQWQQAPTITQSYSPNARKPASGGSRVIAMALTVFSLMGVMTCFAYFFVSITSEKQQRVSELVVSAIPYQTWIDGKLLGLTGHGLKTMLTWCLYGWLALLAVSRFSDGSNDLLAAVSWPLVLMALLFALGGMLFWNTVMAAIAASIDDPNSSTRGSLMFLPTLFFMVAFPGLDAPENVVMQVLSWLPMSSMAAMPARLAHGIVPWWQVLGSFVLLVASILLLRRYASRIFRAGMLFYGKEASWKEIWQWARQAG